MLEEIRESNNRGRIRIYLKVEKVQKVWNFYHEISQKVKQ